MVNGVLVSIGETIVRLCHTQLKITAMINNDNQYIALKVSRASWVSKSHSIMCRQLHRCLEAQTKREQEEHTSMTFIFTFTNAMNNNDKHFIASRVSNNLQAIFLYILNSNWCFLCEFKAMVGLLYWGGSFGFSIYYTICYKYHVSLYLAYTFPNNGLPPAVVGML